MAATITTWEQTGLYDPTNPNQKSYTRYTAIPGGYGTFYYNKVPNTAVLQGAGLGGWDTWPSWAQAAIVAGIGLVGGYFGMQKFGGPIKRKLGLSGPRARRRR